jgi:formylglycine-generating enzyme required for sulfatase activity
MLADTALMFRVAPPARRVHFARGWRMSAYEITHEQFGDFVAATGYVTDAERSGSGMRWTGERFVDTPGRSWRNPGYVVTPRMPVSMVTWGDANAFARWLSAELGAVVRLPTEAEWEYAARASADGLFGDLADTVGLGARARYGRGDDSTQWHPADVGSLKPNAFGLYDMLGNVWEWTADRYVTRPVGGEDAPGPGARVVRGGSWLNGAPSLVTFYRASDHPLLAEPHFGFRVVIERP